MKQRIVLILSVVAVTLFLPFFALAQTSLLTPEETLWLKSRNNTIVVYPEKNNPPFSYETASGALQGLSIEYIELIAEKVGAKIQYLTPRSQNQIISDMQQGKGDVTLSLASDKDTEPMFFFTDSYITVPVVIVARKDFEKNSGLSLSDFNGSRIAIVDGSAALSYVRQNYPRVVIENVTDDEVGLQQVVLGEVDAAVMDVASLSYLLSRQVLTSVKIVGDTGFEYQPAFAISKNKEMLQSIIEKGLSQISTNERTILAQKWVSLPGEQQNATTFWQRLQSNQSILILYMIFALGVIGIFILISHRRHIPWRYFKKKRAIDELHAEVVELEQTSKTLTEQLEEVKNLEEDIKTKIKNVSE